MKIKKLKDNAIIPTRGSEQAAGYDLYACIDEEYIEISANETVLIGTGIAMQIPDGYVGLIYARSGLATMQMLRPANCVGVIDSDYRGEIMVALHNDRQYWGDIFGREIRKPPRITNGQRIAQIIFIPYQAYSFEVVDELDETERGSGSFGSTGD